MLSGEHLVYEGSNMFSIAYTSVEYCCKAFVVSCFVHIALLEKQKCKRLADLELHCQVMLSIRDQNPRVVL